MKRYSIYVMLFAFLGSCALYGQENAEVKLPAPEKEIGKPLMQAIGLRASSRTFDTAPLQMQEVSNILWAADGINRAESGKRTAPSAMNWQEIDVYVILPGGAYVYDAKANALKPVASGDLRSLAGTQGFVKDVPLNLVYVADESRVSRANGDDRLIYTAADAGFIAENVYLYCASEGLSVVVRGSVDRPKLAEALKLRKDQRIILAQSVGHPGK